MADFAASITAGVVPEPWADPGLGDVPSRINFDAEHPQTRLIATVNIAVILTAVVGGVSAPLDATLGGRLFTASMVEHPAASPVVVAGIVGQSSVQTFSPPVAGHYTLVMRRPEGGGYWFHVDARDP